MKRTFFIGITFCAGFFVPSYAQELRKPTETTEIVIKTTYTVRVAVEIAEDDKLHVWLDYQNIYKTDSLHGYHRSGFSASKLLVYAGRKLVRETSVANEMPDPLSVGYNMWIRDGVDLLPHAEEDAQTITIYGLKDDSLLKLGFNKNKVVLGPFDYRVVSAWPVGKDEKGFMYVRAHGSNTAAQRKERGAWEPFGALFVLNKELRLIDSFIYYKVKEHDPLEILTSEGTIGLSKAGNFYLLDVDATAKAIKIKVHKWVPEVSGNKNKH